MTKSNIEWTDDTWNPVVGCNKVSPGCKHCYAETMHARLTAMGQAKYAEPFTVVRPWPQDLAIPLRAKKPRMYFVNSMSDLFHKDVPDEYIAAVFGVMAACPQHTFQILTKRPERMRAWFEWHAEQVRARDLRYQPWRVCEDAALLYLDDISAAGADQPWPLPNVWPGVSIESQDYADRILDLCVVPAAVRMVSAEPLLGPLELGLMGTLPKDLGLGYRAVYERIDWVIIGGESGHHARPFDLRWARALIKECQDVHVPVFVKQLGSAPIGFDGKQYRRHHKGGDFENWAEELRVRQWPEASGMKGRHRDV